jgi:hypothetical protein
MYAVHDGFTDIVKFLLEVGADPNIPDLVSMAVFNSALSLLDIARVIIS